jgi:hypothetical protein
LRRELNRSFKGNDELPIGNWMRARVQSLSRGGDRRQDPWQVARLGFVAYWLLIAFPDSADEVSMKRRVMHLNLCHLASEPAVKDWPENCRFDALPY